MAVEAHAEQRGCIPIQKKSEATDAEEPLQACGEVDWALHLGINYPERGYAYDSKQLLLKLACLKQIGALP